MARYMAFLRAINVGGHTVTMERLREIFVRLELNDVETFIASGNVTFCTRASAARALETRIAARLERELGYAVATFLRSPAELAAIVRHRAFTGAAADGPLYVGFLAREPAAAALRQLRALTPDGDSLAAHGRELYWRCATGMGRSTVSGAMIEKALGQAATFRRSTTVQKLAARYAE